MQTPRDRHVPPAPSNLGRVPSAGLALAGALLLGGCGPVDNERLIAEAQGLNCGGDHYEAFLPGADATAHKHVAAEHAIAEEIQEAVEQPVLANEAFGEIELTYRGSGGLRSTVRAVVDPEDPSIPLGETLDLAISTAIAQGKTASKASLIGPLGAKIRGHLAWFYALKAVADAREGTWEGYDEAFAYLGTGPTGLEVEGVAGPVSRRGGSSSELFATALATACALDRALIAANATVVDGSANGPIAAPLEELEASAHRSFATAIVLGMESLDNLDDQAAASEVLEDAALFAAIEARMESLGDEAAKDAEVIAADFAAAQNALDIGGDPARVVDAVFIADALRRAFELSTP